MDNQENIEACFKDYRRIAGNPVFFIEEYWNKVHTRQMIELSQEDKERIFTFQRILIPYFNHEELFHTFIKNYEEKRLKDLKTGKSSNKSFNNYGRII